MAKRRKIAFDLTYDQFISFWQKSCTYCKGAITTIGLDRVDNNIGYVHNNVVPCCRTCNVMKQKMSVVSFISHIKKINANLL